MIRARALVEYGADLVVGGALATAGFVAILFLFPQPADVAIPVWASFAAFNFANGLAFVCLGSLATPEKTRRLPVAALFFAVGACVAWVLNRMLGTGACQDAIGLAAAFAGGALGMLGAVAFGRGGRAPVTPRATACIVGLPLLALLVAIGALWTRPVLGGPALLHTGDLRDPEHPTRLLHLGRLDHAADAPLIVWAHGDAARELARLDAGPVQVETSFGSGPSARRVAPVAEAEVRPRVERALAAWMREARLEDVRERRAPRACLALPLPRISLRGARFWRLE